MAKKMVGLRKTSILRRTWVFAFLAIAVLAAACDRQRYPDSSNPDSPVEPAVGARPIAPTLPSHKQLLQQALLRPNSHFFRGSDGRIGHATPAPSDPGPRPLIIVNGVMMSADFDYASLPEESVIRIEVLSDDSAFARYGPRAKGGALIFTTSVSR